jgi:hypothetical protein
MSRAPKDMNHLELRGERYGTAGCYIGQDKLSGFAVKPGNSAQKKRTDKAFFASMRNIANSHQHLGTRLRILYSSREKQERAVLNGIR